MCAGVFIWKYRFCLYNPSMSGQSRGTELNDELVEFAATRGGSYLDRLFAEIEPCVHAMVVARLNPKPNQWHAAEEIAQESLLAFAKSISTLQNRTVSGMRAYISGIVDHKVADRIRQQGRPGKRTGSFRSLHSTVAGSSSPARLIAWLSDSGITPISAVDQSEQISWMLDRMGRLKEEYRRVLTYAFFDQLKTAEIAARMNISRPAASMLLLRAVRSLRADMVETMLDTKDGVDREPAKA